MEQLFYMPPLSTTLLDEDYCNLDLFPTALFLLSDDPKSCTHLYLSDEDKFTLHALFVDTGKNDASKKKIKSLF